MPRRRVRVGARWACRSRISLTVPPLSSTPVSGEGSRDKQALVAGLGYSLMSTVMQFNSVLSESAG